jgi:hypothetical protein
MSEVPAFETSCAIGLEANSDSDGRLCHTRSATSAASCSTPHLFREPHPRLPPRRTLPGRNLLLPTATPNSSPHVPPTSSRKTLSYQPPLRLRHRRRPSPSPNIFPTPPSSEPTSTAGVSRGAAKPPPRCTSSTPTAPSSLHLPTSTPSSAWQSSSTARIVPTPVRPRRRFQLRPIRACRASDTCSIHTAENGVQ